MVNEHGQRFPSITSASSPRSVAALVCLVVALSYLVPKLEGAVILNPQTVWPFWPGCAILVSVLLLVPGRIWPILIPAAFATFALYDLQEGVPIKSIAWFVPANTVQVLTSALCLRYFFEGVPRLNSVKAVAKYSFFAVILAPAGAAFFSANGIGGHYWEGWRVCFLSEALAFVALTPAILSWITEGPAWVRKPRACYLEPAALITGLVVLSYVIFAEAGRHHSPALLYSLVPFLLWAALRFGSLGISSSAVLISFLTIWGAIHNRGPFVDQGSLNGILSLQLFLVFAAIPFMFLAALGEERKVGSKELALSNERFNLAMEAGTAVAWDLAVQGKGDVWMGDPQTIFGISHETYVPSAEDLILYVHPEDRQRVSRALHDARQNRGMYALEFRIARPDGSIRWLAARGRYYCSTDDEPERLLGVSLDITERKRAEDMLKESQETLRSIFDSTPDSITVVDLDGRIELCNQVTAHIHGFSSVEQLIGKSVFELIAEEDRQRAEEIKRHVMIQGIARDVLFTGLKGNGEKFPGELSFALLKDDSGRPTGFVGITSDITERKRAEAALRVSEVKYSTVVELTGTGYVVIDSQGRVLDANQEYVHLSGHGALREILGRSVIEWTAEGAKQPNAEAVAQCAKDRSIKNFVTEYVDGKRQATFIEVNATVEGDGEALRIVALCRDVTERVRREQVIRDLSGRLISAQEEERSRIARELHDDVNQRMALLAIELDRLNQQLPPSAVEFHDHIRHASQRLSDIAADIQALSHRLHSSKLEYLGIVSAAKSFCKELSEQQKVEIDFNHTAIPRSVPKEISLCLFRVLQETLQNAVKHSGVRHYKVELHGTEGEIQLTVSDLGVGFDPQDAIHRRGLGLISMRERMQLVSGEFSIKSHPGSGTTIHARVPFDSRGDSARAAG